MSVVSTHLVIATEADLPTPLRMCRQVFVEFGAAGDLEILSVTRSGARARWRLADLAPSPFTTRLARPAFVMWRPRIALLVCFTGAGDRGACGDRLTSSRRVSGCARQYT